MHSVFAVKLYLFNWKRSGQIIFSQHEKEPKRTTYSIYKTGWQLGKNGFIKFGSAFFKGGTWVSCLAETSSWVFSAAESGTLLSELFPCPTFKMHHQKFSSAFHPQNRPTVHKWRGLYEKKVFICHHQFLHWVCKKHDRTSLLHFSWEEKMAASHLHPF